MSKNIDPAPSEQDAKVQERARPESAQATNQEMGTSASPELLANIQSVSAQTRENLPEVTDPKSKELLINFRRLDKNFYLQGKSRNQSAQENSGTRELSPETLLNRLEARFVRNMSLHPKIKWTDVKASLESNPEALTSLALMESAGHEPDVYKDDNYDFYFGTCSQESPLSGRNLNFAEAIEQAETMGITLMTLDHYKDDLQKNGEFDNYTWSWLLTQKESLLAGSAYGYRDWAGVNIDRDRADSHDSYGAWRGSLRVKKS